VFVAARFLGGLAKGNVSLATAIVTDVSTPKTRQKGMAMIGYVFFATERPGINVF
jgi:predicted MFS family arabinose efflux permease